MARISSLNVLLSTSGKDYLAEKYGAVIANIQKACISQQLKNTALSGTPGAGTYEAKRVSVMASGMGIPSIGVYSYELFNFNGVESIIRVGSAGAYHPDLKLFDIILGQGACTNSNFAAQFNLPGTFAPISDFGLLRKAVDACEQMGARYMVGNIMSSDVFYDDDPEAWKKWRQMGVLGAEMEAAALYLTAARFGKKALAIDTISDIIGTTEEATPEQRQTAFDQMIRIALSIAE